MYRDAQNGLRIEKVMFCLFLARQPPVGQGLLIYEVSRSHTQRRTTVGRTPLEE